MVEKRFYRPDELAGVLQVTVRLIYRWIKIGRIRAIPVGDLWRIPSGGDKDTQTVDVKKAKEYWEDYNA